MTTPDTPAPRKPRQPNLRRMHFKADGTAKKPLSAAAAERVRARGWRTYLCPLCGRTHASSQGA